MLELATVGRPLIRIGKKHLFAPVVWIFSLFIVSSAQIAKAELIRIIHTNDLHSQFIANGKATDAGGVEMAGGYARVRKVILDLQERARMEKVPVLTLDAGDFSEGSPFYLASQGEDSFRLMRAMPFDATTLGNHDWLMGPEKMESLFGNFPFPFPVLVSNFAVIPSYRNTNKALQRSKVFIRGGQAPGTVPVKIAVVGLTTDEQVYKWRAPQALISSPVKAFQEERTALMTLPKRERPDFIIALTHIGVKADQDLVRNTKGIDVVVGGHSHTTLKEAVWENNEKGQPVPIVQAGMHGHYVGTFLVEMTPGMPMQFIKDSYQLVPVEVQSEREGSPYLSAEDEMHEHLEMEEKKEARYEASTLLRDRDLASPESIEMADRWANRSMEQLVIDAKRNLKQAYGSDWLAHVVGKSSKDIFADSHDLQPWNHLVARAIKSVLEKLMVPGQENLVLSFDCSMFHGAHQPKGDIDRFQLLSLYPRVFDVTHKKGWTVWKGAMLGIRLHMIVAQAAALGFPFYSAGLTCGSTAAEADELSVDGRGGMDKCTLKNMKVNGIPLNSSQYYFVAVPEGVAMGMRGMPSFVPLIPGNLKDTGISISDAVEAQLLKEKKEF